MASDVWIVVVRSISKLQISSACMIGTLPSIVLRNLHNLHQGQLLQLDKLLLRCGNIKTSFSRLKQDEYFVVSSSADISLHAVSVHPMTLDN